MRALTYRLLLAWRPLVSFGIRREALRALPLALVLSFLVAVPLSLAAPVQSPASVNTTSNGCMLQSARGNIQHVIVVQFDNTHFRRDNPNVPSDLEQMPHLLDFIENNGVLLSNHHTPLISHTATDILTTLTGVYPDRHGVPVSNSFRYFGPDGLSHTGVSFAYWTDPIFDPANPSPAIDPQYNMLTADGDNSPAPWVAYTRAGCNFGSVATANTILENTAVDIAKVFGPGSVEAQEVVSNPGQAFADFVGIGIHCAAENALCSAANNGKPDVLPDEPGGYSNFMGLFGNKYVAPQISASGMMTDLNGSTIQDAQGHVGFPGFDGMSAVVSLAYVAAMQEHGVPVTYAYISDAHDAHPSGPAYGPGQAGYVAALKAYDDAFAKFFTRLANDGLNSGNTLFVFTADEGDHFVGGAPSPAGCDGVNIPCTYSQIGEINANLAGLLATEQGITTPFAVHSDSAPTVYITGNPARDAAVTRDFERGVSKLTALNPITGHTDTLTQFLADPVEMKLLHMITADPARTPTFTMFADPNYFLFVGAANCSSPCVIENPQFAWNHGDVSPDITTTWLGLVGPGIGARGIDISTWSDHTDVRPTILALLGLRDDYRHDGRVLFEEFSGWAVPRGLRNARGIALQLGRTYKQIDAPVGPLGLTTLAISTQALESGNSSDDSTYTQLEDQLAQINAVRDSLAGQIVSLLEAAEFDGQPVDARLARQLISEGQALGVQVRNLAPAH